MAFIWNPNPNPPARVLPQAVPPGEISFEQREVANSVNSDPIYGTGVLSWNASTTHPNDPSDANGDYDIIYTLPTLNVKDIHVTHLEADNIFVRFTATINTANIDTATINTANIVNATIANGHMGVNPTANLQIATKEYVDALGANSTPQGGNLQLLILAAGDLLVGVSDNTAERLPIGTTNGQVLMASSTTGNTGIRWAGPIGSTTSHRGLTIGTNWDTTLMNTQIVLEQVDEIVMDDGYRSNTGWTGLIASNLSNVATSGVGYLDTGVVQPNSCYEIYAIRSSSNGAQGLLLHRAKDTQVDVHYVPPLSTFRVINHTNGLNASITLNVAQRFVAHSSGPFVGIDLVLRRIGNPQGNVWVTLEDNIANNNASGVVLATSRKLSTAGIGALAGTDIPKIRFPFDVSANVVQGNVYWGVVHTDYVRGDQQTNLNYIQIFGDSSPPSLPYADGPAKFFNANTGGWALSNSALAIDAQAGSVGASNFYHRTFVEANDSAVVMPTGYDQKCLLSYASTTKRGFFREYHQRGYKQAMAFHYTWGAFINTGLQGAQGTDMSSANNSPMSGYPEAINLGVFVPPVPCLVWFYKYNGLGGAVPMGIGGLNCTNFPVQLFSETDNSLALTAGGGTINAIGPVFVEFGCVVNHGGASTFSALYIAGIEF